ncbi:MAG: hypothetical protein GTO18_18390 [Anaerolineales bacterium]|nr:hypothetical protein [Anaerolineales bacterium]
MTRTIRITTGNSTFEAQLYECSTAEAIWEALPIQGSVIRWGEEIYFNIPVQLDEAENAREEMAIGELGYWPVGAAFCIFFGPTPVSQGDEPRAYSNVNPFGKIFGDIKALSTVKDGVEILIEGA